MNFKENTLEKITPAMTCVMGVPWDEHSTFMRGPALAPPLIREALHSDSSNLYAENGLELVEGERFCDVGDLELGSNDPERVDSGETLAQIEAAAAALLAREARVLSLGGDHAVTYPLLRAYGKKYEQLNILHIDAHPDLYQDFEGDPHSHACPFARIMEEGLATRLVQLGIRGVTQHLREQAARFGVEMIEMKDWRPGMTFDFDGPLYLSFDLDGLDPAFAPGVSHFEPGGLSVREVLTLIQGLKAPLVGADIVELNPLRDPTGVTARVAAKFLKEIAAQMIATT